MDTVDSLNIQYWVNRRNIALCWFAETGYKPLLKEVAYTEEMMAELELLLKQYPKPE